MKKTIGSLLGCWLVALLVGCGPAKNTVEIPENPKPLPPGGVQLQSAGGDKTAESSETIEVPAQP